MVLSTPAETASTGAGDSDHRLNLFFFRFEPVGLFPDILPGETSWMRAFCLITPFAGEERLSVRGRTIYACRRGQPHFPRATGFHLDVDGERYHLQVILQPMGLDQLNQLWSTQGDTIYRPSLLYEISLMPWCRWTSCSLRRSPRGLGLQVQRGWPRSR